MRVPVVALLFSLALVSGCIDDDGRLRVDDAPAPYQGTPTGSAEHGAAKVDESVVTTGGQPLGFFGATATKTVTISNDFGGVALGVIALGIQEGSVKVESSGGSEYKIVAILEAQAETEQTAREALDRIVVSHDDHIKDGALHLTTGIRYTEAPSMVPLLPNFGFSQAFTTAQVTLTVPSGPTYDLWATTLSGEVTAEDLDGAHIRFSGNAVFAKDIDTALLEIDASQVTLEMIEAAEAKIECNNVEGTDLNIGNLMAKCSGINVAGTFGDLDLNATNNDLTVAATPMRSGTYTLYADQGVLTLSLDLVATAGYDIIAGSDHGVETIDLPADLVYTAEIDGNKTAKSLAFETAATQSMVSANAMHGDVTVQSLDALAVVEEPEP